MRVDQLFKLCPSTPLTHTPTGRYAVVVTPASPSRIYGWRVAVRGPHGLAYVTPANIGDWQEEDNND
jgi:hypothetical protein